MSQGSQESCLEVSLVVEEEDETVSEEGNDLVDGVKTAPLHPLGDGHAGVLEAQLLQDVIHPHRIYLLPSPRQQPA